MAQDREQRVRARAYEIWEREGRPRGRDQDHWYQAERELAAEASDETEPPAPVSEPDPLAGASESTPGAAATEGAPETRQESDPMGRRG
jgi:Protein of unknown function (DUF2934)